jgi:GNAT superfamily N-acetyltransferase
MTHPVDDRYEEEARLADGTRVRLRLLRQDDEDLLRRGFERLSPESRYLRFLAPRAALSPEEVRYLTHVDGHDHLALAAAIVRDDGALEGIGIARFVRLPDDPRVAEPALAVIDDYQGRGLGKLLLARLVEAARERGVEVFRATILPGNARMRRLIDELAPGALEHPDGDALTVEVPLPPPERPHGALQRLLAFAAQDVLRLLRGWH